MDGYALSSTIETILGHRFTRPELLREALTHRSALQGSGRARGSNERLEFVGDRVLGLLMAEWLAERFPKEQEGDLGRRLAHLVSQPVLAMVAEGIGLGSALSVAPGEARAGIKRRATVLADALEAALGAVYYDGGLEAARTVVRQAWDAAMVAQADPPKDAKTRLQEWAQRHTRDLPVYRVAVRSGPPHAPEFLVTVQVGGAQGSGSAGSKRMAEQFAAADLLQTMAQTATTVTATTVTATTVTATKVAATTVAATTGVATTGVATPVAATPVTATTGVATPVAATTEVPTTEAASLGDVAPSGVTPALTAAPAPTSAAGPLTAASVAAPAAAAGLDAGSDAAA
jgi:ribonuclease-3